MSDQLFIAYMVAFQLSVKHTADCGPCLAMEPCPTGDPLHDDFATKQDAWTAEQRVRAANERRRAKRRADSRARMARHAAHELVAHGQWVNGAPAATPASVARRASAMYSGHLKGELITTTEAAAALAAVLGN
ncbi:hypothetical protein [Kitasatospora purpeofusca]|uniref:hypothetical protein n=1 Tax=Kitasatospora purpeofusca TaxID=67352 RepID=UPI00224D0B67|nr:hypothetical protein [Kitasatospora purpeofusca]MCX4754295.1 hypothetical protein [Kitasatospora purpeofusca]WSR33726.1 hypothetical protein OG715_23765 [Kitasatospora purpeofusca]